MSYRRRLARHRPIHLKPKAPAHDARIPIDLKTERPIRWEEYCQPIQYDALPDAETAEAARTCAAFLDRAAECGATAEVSERLQASLAGFLGRKAHLRPTGILAGEVYVTLAAHQALVQFWQEVDGIAHRARVAAHEILRAGLLTALDPTEAIARRALCLRQAVEAAIWGAYFQYGITTAYILFGHFAERHRGEYLFSKEIDDFVRSAVAVEPDRIAAARQAVSDSTTAWQLPEDWVAAMDATNRKQRAVVRFVAEAHPSPAKEDLVEAVETATSAFIVLCGYAHMTPLLVMTTTPMEGERVVELPPFDRLVAHTADAILRLFDALVLEPDRIGTQFLPVAWSITPEATGVRPASPRFEYFKMPFLNDLVRGDRPVTSGGGDSAFLELFDRKKK